MHPEAKQWVVDAVADLDLSGDVLEFGSRYVNGGVRDVIPHERWCGVDINHGDDVDIVANAATVTIDPGTWDVVVSTELLEHTPEGAAIVANAYRHLKPGGWFVATMAGPGRAPHAANGAPKPPPGEHYENVEPQQLSDWLESAGFSTYRVNQHGLDVRCVAQKGGE